MLTLIKIRCYNYALLMRLHRPLPILLLLWPTLWALWIASSGSPSLKILLIFTAGVIVMRSAGCIINDFLDKDFDGYIERTRDRPLVAGSVSSKEALILFTVLCLMALLLVVQLNILTIILAFPGILLTMFYPLAKRFTYFPQIILGITFGGWGVLMVFAALGQQITAPTAWLLFFIGSLWPVIYDTFYAMADRSEDQSIGVKSTAILFGHYDRLITGLMQCFMCVLLFILGKKLSLDWIYFSTISLVAIFFIYQQYLIRTRDKNHCIKAFLNNNWVGFLIFLGLALAYWH